MVVKDKKQVQCIKEFLLSHMPNMTIIMEYLWNIIQKALTM